MKIKKIKELTIELEALKVKSQAQQDRIAWLEELIRIKDEGILRIST